MGCMYDEEDETERIMKYTVYMSRAEMKAAMNGTLDEPEEPDNGCWNCIHYNWEHEACSVNWNNLDESYYNPDTDDRYLDDICEMHDIDPDADWREIFAEDD